MLLVKFDFKCPLIVINFDELNIFQFLNLLIGLYYNRRFYSLFRFANTFIELIFQNNFHFFNFRVRVRRLKFLSLLRRVTTSFFLSTIQISCYKFIWHFWITFAKISTKKFQFTEKLFHMLKFSTSQNLQILCIWMTLI